MLSIHLLDTWRVGRENVVSAPVTAMEGWTRDGLGNLPPGYVLSPLEHYFFLLLFIRRWN